MALAADGGGFVLSCDRLVALRRWKNIVPCLDHWHAARFNMVTMAITRRFAGVAFLVRSAMLVSRCACGTRLESKPAAIGCARLAPLATRGP
jgi:hypothetical protein